MIPILLVFLILCVLACLLTLFFLLSRLSKRAGDSVALQMLQQQLDALREQTTQALTSNTLTVNQQLSTVTNQVNQRLEALDRRLESTTGSIGERLDSAAQVVREVSTSLGELSQATKRVIEVGQNIASLQDILRAPKLRGGFGELFLENLLRQVVPNHYETQYRFRSGERVDAVVKVGERLVPIDSKFPMENFQRMMSAHTDEERKYARKQFLNDVRKHIDAIAAKYIKPDEGTFDFALMYTLAENVYYEIIVRPTTDEESICEYALSRRVIPVSPSTLFANLQTIVLGLRGLQVEKEAQEILDRLQRLAQDFGRFREEFEVLGNHLKNARNKYEDAARRLGLFEDKLVVQFGKNREQA